MQMKIRVSRKTGSDFLTNFQVYGIRLNRIHHSKDKNRAYILDSHPFSETVVGSSGSGSLWEYPDPYIAYFLRCFFSLKVLRYGAISNHILVVIPFV